MSNNPYIVIIYAGKTNIEGKGANNIIASYIEAGVKKSGINVMGPIDINFLTSQEEEENLITKISKSSGLIIGSGVYNGNIEPTLTQFFDKFAGAGFKSSFLASKVAGQFATAADSGTGGQLVLNSLSRLMQTFGANIITGGASRSTIGKPGSGSWHTAQGILGIITGPKTNPTFTNKYIEEDANAYGERIGQIAKFFQPEYNESMSLPEASTGKTCKEFAPECPPNKYNNITFAVVITLSILLFLLILFFFLRHFKRL